MPKRWKDLNATQRNLIIDIIVFCIFLIVSAPAATGIALHEWIGLAIAVPIITHLVMHWKWIVQISKRLFGDLPNETRLNFIWDICLFFVICLATVSGLLISEAMLPTINIHFTIDPFWYVLHDISSNLFMIMIGVHLALHWDWIKTSIKRYLFPKAKQIQESAIDLGE